MFFAFTLTRVLILEAAILSMMINLVECLPQHHTSLSVARLTNLLMFVSSDRLCRVVTWSDWSSTLALKCLLEMSISLENFWQRYSVSRWIRSYPYVFLLRGAMISGVSTQCFPPEICQHLLRILIWIVCLILPFFAVENSFHSPFLTMSTIIHPIVMASTFIQR